MRSAEERRRLEEEREAQRLANEQAEQKEEAEEAPRSGARNVGGIMVFSDDDDTPQKKDTVSNSGNELPSWETKIDAEKTVFEGLGFLKAICIGVLIGVLLVVFVIQRNNVGGPSMQPNFSDGDVVFVEKISTYTENYKRGDVVVLDGSDMEGYEHEEYLIKRIVALPGETIKFDAGKVFIKEKGQTAFSELKEDYLAVGTVTTVDTKGLKKGYGEYMLKPDEYFCLGDNRTVSNDSRILGPFTEDRIKGVAFIRVYPFSKIGFIK